MSAQLGNAGKPRILAFIIDNLLATIVAFLAIAAVSPQNPVFAGFIVCGVYLLYFFSFEASWSRTPGKFFQGLYVSNGDGSRCSIGGAAVRTLARVLEANPLLLGGIPAGIVILATKRKQRIGDLLAGTIVIAKVSDSASSPR